MDRKLTTTDFKPLVKDKGEKEAIARPMTSYWKDVWRNFKKRKTAVYSMYILIVIILLILIGPLLSGYNYYSNDYDVINQLPSINHWFGTDSLGRDLFTRVCVGGRVSLFIAIVATILPYGIGMTIGGISGYFGGTVDMIIMRIIDVLMGIPAMIYNILLMIVLGSGDMMTLVIAFTLTGWMGSARTTRGLVLQIKERDFIMASETLGASPMRIIFKRLLPNTLGILVVGMTLSVPNIIFSEAFLSFIGLGVAPPRPSWGQLIKSASEVFKDYPYQFLFPCLFVSLTMLCFNLIGDGLRDALDPKLRT